MIKPIAQGRRWTVGSKRLLLLSLLMALVLVLTAYAAAYRPGGAAAQSVSPAGAAQTNYALQFDGADDFARVLDIGSFDFATSFTIEAWVKPDSVSGPSVNKALVSGRDVDLPGGSGGWAMFLPSGDHSRWGMSVCTPVCEAATTPAGSLAVGEWHHLAAVYDGASVDVYHNGVLTGTAAHSGDVTDVNYLFLGAWTGTFSGTIDEVRIWNIARSQQALLSTMFAPLQGDETGLAAYWPLDEGAGQFAVDGTGGGQSARLGSSDTADAQDPVWVSSDSPILEPLFLLTPYLGGLGTDIGISSVVVAGFNCSWAPGETVEIWWDKPEARLATFTVEPNGCFEGFFNLDDTERITGSQPGQHAVQARGSVSGVVELPFEQTPSQLHLNPIQGPSDFEVSFEGCGWDGASTVDILWQRNNSQLIKTSVDAGGCINGTLRIPRAKDGFQGFLALSNGGHVSAAAYWVKSATIRLTPAEGPPDSRVPLTGCGWLPQEQIDFAFAADGQTFDSWGTSLGGCISTGGPTEPVLKIPVTATLGAKTIQATGLDSGFVVEVPFKVVTRTLALDPDTGLPGHTVAASGCGWVGNSSVTVEWGYPDTNNQPIRWQDSVDGSTGCFGQSGSFTFTVPANSINGPVVQTATGDVSGSATAVFTVTHNGRIEIPNADGYAGSPMTVNIFDAILGETITFRWDVGYAFDGVGAAAPDFSYDITLPKYASVGQYAVIADGSKGFDDQAMVNVLDNAEIAVLTGGDIYPGQEIRVRGSSWAAGEIIRFELQSGADRWPMAGSVTVGADALEFSELIPLPADVPAGVYTLLAKGNKGRDAVTSVTLSVPPTPAFSLAADYAAPPPDLDGSLRRGEWDYSKRVNLSHGFISARSDESRLYILLDMLGDTGQDGPGADNFWLSFDVWNNRQIDAGFDLNFRLDSSGDFIYEEYSGANSFSPRNSADLRSAYGEGFGCFLSDGSLRLTLVGFIPRVTCSSHRVWEIGIDLASIGAQPGDTVSLGVRTISPSPAFDHDIPDGFPSDFSELGVITLADSKVDANPPAGRVLGIRSGGFEIEVTQAIQDAANSLSLVADKETVVRVYPDVEAEAMVRVFLYGRRGGVDLPGSPLVTIAAVPDVIDRQALSHTANFLLPESWIGEGVTQLTAVAENLNGQNSKAAAESVNFYKRDVPVIWVFPFNEGTRAAPLLPTQADMVEQELVLERMLPAPSVTFVHRPWTEIGTTNPISFTTMKKELSDYWRVMAIAAASSNNLSALPDMLYGFKVGRDPKAVGTSDPIYSGGNGLVVVGQADGSDFNSTTMIHEVNHNLDRSSRGTWGRHVADPEDVDSRRWGCGADGPDPAWPYDGTDNIQEVGFDTNRPWTDGTGEHLSVVPDTRDDFMSYCWKKGTPIQWISPYRWQAMFTRLVPVGRAASIQAAQTITDVYYLSGQVNLDGSGSLAPMVTQPGVAAAPVISGTYTIEVEDASQQTLYAASFTAVFTDAEGVPLGSVDFSYQLPAQGSAARIVLKHDGQVLDSIDASPNPPTLAVTAPSNGDEWSGEEAIRWTAGDEDGDELQFMVLYSPDGGDNWFPVASGLTGNEYLVDVNRLPGGAGGRVRVLASDGFHTVTAESSGLFTVPQPAPTVIIDTPAEGSSYHVDEWIVLKGRASSPAVTAAEAFTYTWAVDGEVIEIGPEANLLLDEGEYTITLYVYDGLGNYGEAAVTIHVVGDRKGVYLPVIMR